MQRRVVDVDEKVPFLKGLPLSFQHLFAMFGASVLVPFIINSSAGELVVDPALVLLMNGIGTLLFLFIGKGKAPAFLGSSFAFLSPAIAILNSGGDVKTNYAKVLGGFILSGLLFVLIAFIIGKVGTAWLDIILPPAAMGPVVALIGLELAGVAADWAGLFPKDGVYDKNAIIVSMFTLFIAIFGTLLFRGFFAAIPILLAVLSGYALSAILGIPDYSVVASKAWFAAPKFVHPIFDLNAMMIIAPATLVVLSEHIGHILVTGNIVGRDLTKDPGLHRTLFSDGFSTALSGLMGSVPTTTYGENMGVMAITRVYSVWVIGGAAIISIIISFFGKLSGAIISLPTPVMGGISLLLFGIIGASGIRMLVEAQVDYSKSKNLILTAVIFVTGLSGVVVKIGEAELKGMGLASIVGMSLSLVFYILDKLKLTNESEEE